MALRFSNIIFFIIGICILVFTPIDADAQNLNNYRQQSLLLSNDSIILDSLSIVPASVIVKDKQGKILSDKLYRIDEAKALLIIDQKYIGQTISLSYRVFPVHLRSAQFASLYRQNLSQDSLLDLGQIIQPSPYAQNYTNLSSETLNRSGYISRGLNFGNNQDVVVNSALNMQLSGQLSEGIQIKAAITDNNIPIQPEGNTQQIQEFDKVFISIYNDRTSLTLGDFDLNQPKGYFLNSRKKVMGGTIKHRMRSKRHQRELEVSVSGAVSKGKFNRMNIPAQEGIQGPYPLRGANNESFIIVLAGTEKVYLDGVLLKRGEQNDYVIDYNLAEITFTTYRAITKDSRIVVEFEYSDKNYAKFTVANAIHYKTKQSDFWFNLLSDHESKHQPINADYSDEEKQILLLAGDNPLKAIAQSIDSAGFVPNEVRYAKVDSLGYDSVFVYSTDPEKAVYRLTFAFVGEGNGDYVQQAASANGRVFKWVQPQGGQHQGSYLPVKLLVAPRSQQMYTTGGHIRLKSYTHIQYELALSQFDANTYSYLDAKDNTGWAYQLKASQDLLTKDTTKQQLQVFVLSENVNRQFKAFERFKSVEFQRDWNLQNIDNKTTQTYGAGIAWNRKSGLKAEYLFKMLQLEDNYLGVKHEASALIQTKKINSHVKSSWLKSETNLGKTDFLRTQALLAYNLKEGWSVGLKEASENNLWQDSLGDYQNSSYGFLEWEAFSQWESKKDNRFVLSYQNRKDKGISNKSLSAASNSQTLSAQTEVNSIKNQRLKANFNWREVRINDSIISKLKNNEQNFMGQLEHSVRLFKNALSFRTMYELSSGLELKKEFAYVEVAAGQGVYQWIDYNGNGVQELDEFVKANFQDQAKFIKVYMPGNTYVKAYSNQFTETMHWYPYKIWKNKNDIRKYIAKFSNLLSYKVRRKVRGDDYNQILNPFGAAVLDTNLLSMNQSIRNTLSFNKTSAVFSLDYVYLNNQNKLLLTNGFDSRQNSSHGINFRINFSRKLSLNNQASRAFKSYYSEFFPVNNYELSVWSDKLELSLQLNQNFRISTHYQYKDKQNTIGIQKAELHQLGAEVKYNVATKSNIQLNVDYFNFSYNDKTNNSIAYEMLEGLLPGNNGQWTALFQTKLSKYLQLNLSYIGRVADEGDVIHNGQAQLRAFF